MWVRFGCGGILSCSDSHKIVILFPLHIACNFYVMPHTAHRGLLLSAARIGSISRHLARSNTVHVESSHHLRSRKAQCQPPSGNPETGDTSHSGERRSCDGEEIENQNEYKQLFMHKSEADYHKPGIYGGSV